eukprot:GHVS01020219.1.p1 GENE.GHVS01020219.1~~GHVS01020219.1.p1  ORF type:complete len:418 (+),score=63.63 GHVS01020219.1:68-1321(+)
MVVEVDGDEEVAAEVVVGRTSWDNILTCKTLTMSLDEMEIAYKYSMRYVTNTMRLDNIKLQRFHEAVRLGYRDNPYHNFYHATQVFQGCHVALTKYKCNQWLRPVDQLALLTGALCHDIDHPGVNNDFLKQLRHPLAILYDDISVLEHHHAAYSLRLMSRNESIDFRQDMSSTDRSEYHKKLLLVILATDMQTSSTLATKLKAAATARRPRRTMKQNKQQKSNWWWRRRRQEQQHAINQTTACDEITTTAAVSHGYDVTVSPPLDITNEGERDLLLSGIIHCMDISNVLTGPPVNFMWAGMVAEEFRLQVELEKQMSLPVTSAFDSKSDVDRINLQIGFLDFLVLPRWRSFSELTGAFGDLVEQGEINSSHLKAKRSEEAVSVDEQSHVDLSSVSLNQLVGKPFIRRMQISDKRDVL